RLPAKHAVERGARLGRRLHQRVRSVEDEVMAPRRELGLDAHHVDFLGDGEPHRRAHHDLLPARDIERADRDFDSVPGEPWRRRRAQLVDSREQKRQGDRAELHLRKITRSTWCRSQQKKIVPQSEICTVWGLEATKMAAKKPAKKKSARKPNAAFMKPVQ